MPESYTITEAKNRLPSLVHRVEKGPAVKLTRHGRPVAVLVSRDTAHFAVIEDLAVESWHAR